MWPPCTLSSATLPPAADFPPPGSFAHPPTPPLPHPHSSTAPGPCSPLTAPPCTNFREGCPLPNSLDGSCVQFLKGVHDDNVSAEKVAVSLKCMLSLQTIYLLPQLTSTSWLCCGIDRVSHDDCRHLLSHIACFEAREPCQKRGGLPRDLTYVLLILARVGSNPYKTFYRRFGSFVSIKVDPNRPEIGCI